jgi:hypothetical protein
MTPEEQIELEVAMEAHYCKVMLPQVKQAQREYDANATPFELAYRLVHLWWELAGLEFRVVDLQTKYLLSLRAGENYLNRALLADVMERTKKDIKNLRHKIAAIEGRISPSKAYQECERVTEAQIEIAKQYPWESLLEVGRSHMARCPFHEDKGPSFYVKGGFGYCFGCGWKGDTIAFRMKQAGETFAAAVRSLQ